jgi:5-methylcytosine-specific restriction enzyme subunit McrC
MPAPINLFEFVKYPWESSKELKDISDKNKFSDNLEKVLDKIWAERKRFIPSELLYYQSSSKKQRFIDFRKNEIVPRNWIGTIHLRSNNEEYVVNLLPKIFYKENHTYTTRETDSIFAHILWWLSGSEKQNYSSMESSLGALKSDLLEILVWIYSSYTLEVLSSTSYNYYETVSEDIETVKGQIDFNSYVQNFDKGKKYQLPCVFDSFQYDNLFNRIVKYISTILKDFTINPQTKRNLEEILFILDDVEYSSVTIEDCDKVVLNPIYTEFRTILDNCSMFLSSLSVYKWKDDYSVFALLIPSEKLFENFIFSVLKNNISSPIKSVSRSRPKSSRIYLVRQLPSLKANKYKMINDIVVELEDKSFILFDTKYKRLFNLNEENEEWNEEYNISQADIYQMVSYAIGSGISNIGLIYPQLPFDNQNTPLPIYEIEDEFTNGTVIRIHPFKVDIVHSRKLEFDLSDKLENIFESTTKTLIHQLNDVVKAIKL